MGETIKKYIRHIILALRITGLHTDAADFFRTRYYWIYSVIFNGFFMTGLNLTLVLYLAVNCKKMDITASSAYLTPTFIMPSIKVYFYLKNWPMIRNLMVRIDEEDFQPKNLRQMRKSDSFFMALKFMHYLFLVMGSSLVISWITIPIISSRDYEDKKLPFHAWYPYDWRKSVLYELTYAHQSVGLMYLISVNIHLDMITFAFISYVAIECILLTDTLRNIDEFTGEKLKFQGLFYKESDSKYLAEMHKMLIECVKHHRKIMNFAEDTNAFFNILIFCQFGCSLFSMCLTMYEITVVKSPVELLVLFILLGGVSGEILFYSFFGDEIISKSSEIATALYETPWMNCSIAFKRDLHFFILKTQKPIRMLALDFFVLSLPTCAAIFRSAWSFFIMLKQTQ